MPLSRMNEIRRASPQDSLRQRVPCPALEVPGHRSETMREGKSVPLGGGLPRSSVSTNARLGSREAEEPVAEEPEAVVRDALQNL